MFMLKYKIVSGILRYIRFWFIASIIVQPLFIIINSINNKRTEEYNNAVNEAFNAEMSGQPFTWPEEPTLLSENYSMAVIGISLFLAFVLVIVYLKFLRKYVPYKLSYTRAVILGAIVGGIDGVISHIRNKERKQEEREAYAREVAKALRRY